MYFLLYVLIISIFLKNFSILSTGINIDYYGDPLNLSMTDNELIPSPEDEILDLSKKDDPLNSSIEDKPLNLSMKDKPLDLSKSRTTINPLIHGSSVLHPHVVEQNPLINIAYQNLQPIFNDQNIQTNVDNQLNLHPHVYYQQNPQPNVEDQNPPTNTVYQNTHSHVDIPNKKSGNNSSCDPSTNDNPIKLRIKEMYIKEFDSIMEISKETVATKETPISSTTEEEDILVDKILTKLNNGRDSDSSKKRIVAKQSETIEESKNQTLGKVKRDGKALESGNAKRHCSNHPVNSAEKETVGNTESNPNDEVKEDLIIVYKEKAKKESNIKPKDIKKINVDDNCTTYKIPDYHFGIDVKLFKKNVNQETLRADGNENVSKDHFFAYFTSVFCKVKSNENIKTFTVKKEFKCLELIIPEFLPFINFINEMDCSKKVNSPAPIPKEKINDFNKRLNDFLSNYFKIFDDDFVGKYKNCYSVYTLLKDFHADHRSSILEFRNLLVKFLKMINVEEKLINCYRVLIDVYTAYTIKPSYSFTIDKDFFVFFIINTDNINDTYLEKSERLKNILSSTELVHNKKKENIVKVIECGFDNIGITALRLNYEKFLNNMSMHKFKMEDHFRGWVSFDKKNRDNNFFYYNKSREKYKERVGLQQILGIFYLEVLKQLLPEQDTEKK